MPELGRGDIGGIATRFDGRLAPLQSRSLLLHIVTIVSLVIAVSGLPRSFAAEQPSDVPAWLQAHVGEGEGQIAQVVLQRARALYLQKVSEGAVKNPCYFAMDATRPGGFARRFYVICEADRSFRAIPVGSRQRPQFERHREFRQRKAMREELQQCDGFQADDRRGLCDGRDDHVFQRLLSRLGGKIRGFQPLVRAVRRRRRRRQRQTARHRRASGRVVAGSLSSKRSGQPVREPGRLRSVWTAGELQRRPQQRLHQLVAVGRRANHPDDEGADDALHLS